MKIEYKLLRHDYIWHYIFPQLEIEDLVSAVMINKKYHKAFHKSYKKTQEFKNTTTVFLAQFTKQTKEEFLNAKELDLPEKNLTSFPKFIKFQNLKTLDLSKNKIKNFILDENQLQKIQ